MLFKTIITSNYITYKVHQLSRNLRNVSVPNARAKIHNCSLKHKNRKYSVRHNKFLLKVIISPACQYIYIYFNSFIKAYCKYKKKLHKYCDGKETLLIIGSLMNRQKDFEN